MVLPYAGHLAAATVGGTLLGYSPEVVVIYTIASDIFTAAIVYAIPPGTPWTITVLNTLIDLPGPAWEETARAVFTFGYDIMYSSLGSTLASRSLGLYGMHLTLIDTSILYATEQVVAFPFT